MRVQAGRHALLHQRQRAAAARFHQLRQVEVAGSHVAGHQHACGLRFGFGRAHLADGTICPGINC